MSKILFFIIFLLTASISNGQKDTSTYFEGYIDYKAEYRSKIPDVTNNEMRDRFGEFLRIYYKDGNFKWVFKDNAGYVRSYLLTLQKVHTEYAWDESAPDTLFATNKNKERVIHLTSYTETAQDTVLGCLCRVLQLTGTAFHDSPNGPVNANFIYSFCPSLRINPDHYKEFKNFKWDEITKKMRSIAIKMVSEYEGIVVGTFTAVSINPGPVDPSEFVIDRTKIVKPVTED